MSSISPSRDGRGTLDTYSTPTSSPTAHLASRAGMVRPRGRQPSSRRRSLTGAPADFGPQLHPTLRRAGYRAGQTVYELAARFGIHRVTVSTHLHRTGVTLRRQGLDDDGIQQAVGLYGQGWSVARIGTRLGVDGTTVWTALKAQGLRMRDTHRRER